MALLSHFIKSKNMNFLTCNLLQPPCHFCFPVVFAASDDLNSLQRVCGGWAWDELKSLKASDHRKVFPRFRTNTLTCVVHHVLSSALIFFAKTEGFCAKVFLCTLVWNLYYLELPFGIVHTSRTSSRAIWPFFLISSKAKT